MDASASVKRKRAFENKAVEYHPRQAIGVGEALSLENDLTMSLQWPKKKRNPRLRTKKSAHVPRRFNQNPGSVLLGKSGTFSSPQELVEEILSRLPVKSLARFSCVSKLWYHLIYSERFASLHISNYKTSQLLVGSCYRGGKECSMSFLPNPPLDGVYCDSDKVASQKVLELSPGFFGGSINGIVCLYAYTIDDIRLWNPATNDVRVIPKSGIPRLLGPRVDHIVGLGFDPKTNDYKILQMVFQSYSLASVIQLELYSLRKNSWRKVDSHDFYFHANNRIPDAVCSLPLTEYKVICGLVRTLNRSTRCEIFLFDVSSEILDYISIPQSVEADFYGVNNCIVKVFPFQESVALGISRLGLEGERIFNIWALNDLYVSRSWSKMVSVEHNLGHRTRIIGIWENRILYQATNDMYASIIGLFDVGNMENTELNSWLGKPVSASIYKESIVRVWEGKRRLPKIV